MFVEIFFFTGFILQAMLRKFRLLARYVPGTYLCKFVKTFSNICPQPTCGRFSWTFSLKTLFSPFLQFCKSWKRHFSFNPTSQGFLLMNVPTCGIRDPKMVPVPTFRWAKLAHLLQQESLQLVQPGVRVDLSALSLLSRSLLILIWPMR